ncbi:PAS domain-containing sensor histidine kinase [Evansella sp. AB-rgal1]|uniref:sensor histidine kinase n=1 Tax=Evansella sp. AB-rgal1 TaxID=3242696 RepID=UPI00359D0FA4
MTINHEKTIVDFLSEAKPLILVEINDIIRESNDLFSGDKEKVEIIFMQLIDTFLDYLGNKNTVTNEGTVCLVELKMEKKIPYERLLPLLDKVYQSLNNHMDRQIIDELDKLKGKVALNYFFQQLYRDYSIYMHRENEVKLMGKNREIHKLKNERVQILSKLSNSFAHEIRNPLTSIKGFIQLLESRSKKHSEEDLYFNYINQEIKELEEQVNQMLYLSHGKSHQDFHHSHISLNELINNALTTFQPVVKDNDIQIDIQLEKLVVIHGIEDQLKLAFYKLIQNAIDALLMKEFGRKIVVNLVQLEDCVQLTIANNGPPIPSPIKQNIFDPFVSTKELGKGIGLSITKQIVEKHNGTISCYSRENWIEFEIKLPFTKKDTNLL